ncbi:MAG TPA: DUF3426 domain-containing protein, partial [Stellaceae bacterium]|nr:DUF3426 domain-containing protein [Stellaceae bacterium]
PMSAPPMSAPMAQKLAPPAPATPRPTPRRRSASVAIGWMLLILAFGGLAFSVVWERDEVVALWPPAEDFYALIGLPAAANDGGLVVRNLRSAPVLENGVPTLVVEGEVLNTSSRALTVPKFKLVLSGADDKELLSWNFSVSKERLTPEESVSFRTSITRPSDVVKNVRVTIAGDKE